MTFDELLHVQHGVFTRSQALRLGVTRSELETRVRRGQWRRVHPRVYAAHAGPLPTLAREAAALLYAGAGAVLGFASAAHLHGLVDAPAAAHVLLLHGRRVLPVVGVVVHRSRTLRAVDVVTRRGLPVSAVARTVCDVLRSDPAEGRSLVASAVQRRLTTPARVREAGLRTGLAGRRDFEQLLADVEGGSLSALELDFVDLCRRFGLPHPQRQYRIGGRFVDAAFLGGLVVAELDSRAHHLSATDWEHDLARQNEIMVPGRVLLRFTWRMVRTQPELVAARLRTALDAALTRSVGETEAG